MYLLLLFMMSCQQDVPVKSKDRAGCAGCSLRTAENAALPPALQHKTRQTPDLVSLKMNLLRSRIYCSTPGWLQLPSAVSTEWLRAGQRPATIPERARLPTGPNRAAPPPGYRDLSNLQPRHGPAPRAPLGHPGSGQASGGPAGMPRQGTASPGGGFRAGRCLSPQGTARAAGTARAPGRPFPPSGPP